jgi:2-oxoglutarate ferredoxin oxidoreductase subunit beta
MLYLEEGKPLLFGAEGNKGIRMNGLSPEIVTVGENGITEEDVILHHSSPEYNLYHTMLSQLIYPEFPTPVGVIHSDNTLESYEDLLEKQIESAIEKKGKGDLQALIRGHDSWQV